MTIMEYLLKVLERERCIVCLRSLVIDTGFDYGYLREQAHRAAEQFPGKVQITRLPDQQGRPLCLRWIGD